MPDAHRGPLIIDRRPRRRLRCLGCNKVFVTLAAIRLCRACTARSADLLRGGLPVAGFVLPGRRD